LLRLTAASSWLLWPTAAAFGAWRRRLPGLAAAASSCARLLPATPTVSAGRPRLAATAALGVQLLPRRIHLLPRLAATRALILVQLLLGLAAASAVSAGLLLRFAAPAAFGAGQLLRLTTSTALSSRELLLLAWSTTLGAR